MKRMTWIALPMMMCAAVAAQDTRVVTEPKIPPTCVKLSALLSATPAIDAAEEAKLDTTRLQKALDTCGAGKAVELAADGAKNAFLTGPIELRKGVTLLVDRGVTLYGSRDPQVYEKAAGSCGVVNEEKRGCKTLIVANDAPGSGIMGDGTIDGRGGAKLLKDGKDQSKTWWDLANDARAGGNQQVPRLIETEKSDDFTLYRITLKNSANFHVVPHHTNGITVWGLKIDTPANARNTDGFDPSASSNITVAYSYIRTGDDNIAIKAGDGPVTNMSVLHNHFYYGHGMSIGSETMGGVSKLLVRDLSLDGTTSGIRIKSNPSRGGLVDGAQYDDVCIRNAKAPIDITTAYTYAGSATDLYPEYKNISLHNVRIVGGGKFLVGGLDHVHRVGIRFDGVLLTDGPTLYKFTINHADIGLGPGPGNFMLTGEDSTVRGAASNGTLPACDAKFVPFPAM